MGFLCLGGIVGVTILGNVGKQLLVTVQAFSSHYQSLLKYLHPLSRLVFHPHLNWPLLYLCCRILLLECSSYYWFSCLKLTTNIESTRLRSNIVLHDLSLALGLVFHVPVDLLMLSRTIKHLSTQWASLVS